MQSILKSSIAAAVIVLGTAIAAEARPVLVTSDLNVRVGPGTQHPSVGVIRGGSTAEVGRCFDGWCEIAWGPLRGFSSQAYLDGGGPQYAPAYVPPPPPPVYYGPRPYYDPYHGPYRHWRRRHCD
jgi:uncharacterized protein YraI